MYPEATTQSDRGTATRSSGLGTPQMNLTLPSGSQPPDWIVPTGRTAEQRNNAARNIRDFMLIPPTQGHYNNGSRPGPRGLHSKMEPRAGQAVLAAALARKDGFSGVEGVHPRPLTLAETYSLHEHCPWHPLALARPHVSAMLRRSATA